MKSYFGLLLATIVTLSIASRSEAGVILSVDLDPATAGIQSTNSVPLNIGDSITANLLAELTGTTSTVGYNFSVQFGNGLQLVSRTEVPFAAGFQEQDTSNGLDGNTALRFDGGTLGAAATAPLGPNQVGSITFTVIGPGATTITPGFFEPAFDFFLDGTGLDVIDQSQITLVGGTVNVAAVPEPSSMALLAVAGVGGWVARRRAARKQAAK